MNNKEEFGVVYQNKKGIANVGCTVNVTKLLKKYSDGRMDIMSKGNKIFRLDSKRVVDEIVVGEITILPDPDPLSKKIFDPLLEKYLKILF